MEHSRDFMLEEDGEDTQKDQYLTFISDKEVYAVEIQYATEIIGVPPITKLPELDEYVRGLINLRGQFIPMLDVRARLGKEEVAYTDKTCTVVVEYEGYTVGMIIDAVSDVVYIPEENMIDPPRVQTSYHHEFIKGIGKPETTTSDNKTDAVRDQNLIVLIIDLEKLLQIEKGGDENDNRG